MNGDGFVNAAFSISGTFAATAQLSTMARPVLEPSCSVSPLPHARVQRDIDAVPVVRPVAVVARERVLCSEWPCSRPP